MKVTSRIKDISVLKMDNHNSYFNYEKVLHEIMHLLLELEKKPNICHQVFRKYFIAILED